MTFSSLARRYSQSARFLLYAELRALSSVGTARRFPG